MIENMVPKDGRKSILKIKDMMETHYSDSSLDEVAEDLDYEVKHSKANCKLKYINSFIYGGMSSRFWMLRKHTISINFEAGSDL